MKKKNEDIICIAVISIFLSIMSILISVRPGFVDNNLEAIVSFLIMLEINTGFVVVAYLIGQRQIT